MAIATKAWVTEDAQARRGIRMDRKWLDHPDTYVSNGRQRTRCVNSEIQQFICLDNSISDGLNAFTLLHCLGSEKFVRI